MRAEIMRSVKPGHYTLLIEGDSADITSLIALLRAGGDCTIVQLIGEEAAKEPANVAVLRECLSELFLQLIPVAEKFSRLHNTTKP